MGCGCFASNDSCMKKNKPLEPMKFNEIKRSIPQISYDPDKVNEEKYS